MVYCFSFAQNEVVNRRPSVPAPPPQIFFIIHAGKAAEPYAQISYIGLFSLLQVFYLHNITPVFIPVSNQCCKTVKNRRLSASGVFIVLSTLVKNNHRLCRWHEKALVIRKKYSFAIIEKGPPTKRKAKEYFYE